MAIKYYQGQHILSRDVFWGKLTFADIRILKRILSFFYKFVHMLVWWPWRFIFYFFFHLKVETKENLKKFKGPLIVVSNHSCWFDPFLISSSFPFLAKIHAIRFACWHKYYYSFKYYVVAHLLGSFPVFKKIGLKESLKFAVKILKNKGVVGIFPEGKRYHKGRYSKGRRGTSFLAIKTKTKILPIKIEGTQNLNFIKFILRKQKIKVKIGKPFSLPSQKINSRDDLNEPTKLIMRKIREL